MNIVQYVSCTPTYTSLRRILSVLCETSNATHPILPHVYHYYRDYKGLPGKGCTLTSYIYIGNFHSSNNGLYSRYHFVYIYIYTKTSPYKNPIYMIYIPWLT